MTIKQGFYRIESKTTGHSSTRGAHLLSSVCTAVASREPSSLATRSPRAARQSSTEPSGLMGLNTSEEWRSKPVLKKAVRGVGGTETQRHIKARGDGRKVYKYTPLPPIMMI